jgi:hypothetical protein
MSVAASAPRRGFSKPVPVSLREPVAVGGTVRTSPADNPTPVSRVGILTVTPGSQGAQQTLFTVPTGKRLMIQSETGWTQTWGGARARVWLNAFNTSGGALFSTILPQDHRGSWDGQGEIYEGSTAIPMFADAGQRVDAMVSLSTVATADVGVPPCRRRS